MRSTRRRPDRPDPARGRTGPNLEALEGRLVLSSNSFLSFYQPTGLVAPRTVDTSFPPTTSFHPQSISDAQLASLSTEGKVVTGKDRQGDEYSITVHGPGYVIVTDTSPNDGVLDDEIDTIQIVGSSLNSTYVTGQVTASARLQTTGTVEFNHLIATQGVASIILNGFTLARTAGTPASQPSGTTEPEIYLPGGVRYLQFHNIDATIDLATTTQPFNIVIGDPTTPLEVAPTIRLDEIFNTVFNSNASTVNVGALVAPSVNILVNGQLHGLEMISSTAAPVPAAYQFEFPTIGVTGRTAIRALGIDRLDVAGSAINVTASRQAIPFLSSLSGLDHLGSASFGGTADALGLDVSGPIGRLRFARGLGNPTGVNFANTPTAWGTPNANFGVPAFGLLGGLVTGTRIGSLSAAPANTQLLTATDPDRIMQHRVGYTTWYPIAGNALSGAVIASSGSIGRTTVIGNEQNSEITAGFHYPSYTAGLEPVRAPSRIGPLRQNGADIDAVTSSTYRPNDAIYGNGNDVAGPGTIRGNLNGGIYFAGGTTPLQNQGAGYFARRKIGDLPPPQVPRRIHGVLVVP